MRAPTLPRGSVQKLAIAGATIGSLGAVLAWPSPAAATGPPAACTSGRTLTDPAGDGHHPNTDVTAGWLTETGGRLQAVIQVTTASWAPAHDDSAAASFAFLFAVGDEIRFVRGETPRTGPAAYDAGTWTKAGGFTSTTMTTGATTDPGGSGAITIDVPAAIAPAGARLGSPFVLTSDGVSGGVPHWVDAAPGGTSPDTVGAGADYVVGSCGGASGTPPAAIPAPGAGGPSALTAVSLVAPTKLVGTRSITLRGTVSPATAGVPVRVVQTTRGGSTTWPTTTAADGAWSLAVRVKEQSTWRATASGLGSSTETTRVVAKVTASVRRTRSGGLVVTGSVSPQLPGRVLWLRTDAVSPSAKTSAKRGRFAIRLAHPRPGTYQALFIPSRSRAERGLSPRKTIR